MIGQAGHVTVIAEAGVNHNGDRQLAMALIDAAAEAGADIVKFQTFKSEHIASAQAPKAVYQQQNTGNLESQRDMIRRLELGHADHVALMSHAQDRGIRFLSTPFDSGSIELLHSLGMTTGKIPSGEVTNLPYLRSMARAFPELIMSTGMADIDEVAAALDVLYRHGADRERLTLLHCTTEYPAPMQDVNLRAMLTLQRTFGTRVGYSDHTIGIEIPIAAVALGATVIEKHITLDRELPGPDHRASIEPQELIAMVSAIRHVSLAMGTGEKRVADSELGNRAIARKSIHWSGQGKAGQVVSEDDLRMLRPGTGISPMHLHEVLGRRLAKDVDDGHLLEWNDLV
jgi:N,N'-diacetyllegionaminate synthase